MVDSISVDFLSNTVSDHVACIEGRNAKPPSEYSFQLLVIIFNYMPSVDE